MEEAIVTARRKTEIKAPKNTVVPMPDATRALVVKFVRLNARGKPVALGKLSSGGCWLVFFDDESWFIWTVIATKQGPMLISYKRLWGAWISSSL